MCLNMKKLFIYTGLFSILILGRYGCKKYLTTEVVGQYPES